MDWSSLATYDFAVDRKLLRREFRDEFYKQCPVLVSSLDHILGCKFLKNVLAVLAGLNCYLVVNGNKYFFHLAKILHVFYVAIQYVRIQCFLPGRFITCVFRSFLPLLCCD